MVSNKNPARRACTSLVTGRVLCCNFHCGFSNSNAQARDILHVSSKPALSADGYCKDDEASGVNHSDLAMVDVC